MKPPPFRYYDPATVDEALGLLGRLDNAKLLAGGQSLMPMLNLRFVYPSHLIDLNKVSALSYLRDEGESLAIGAMTRQRDVEFSPSVQARFPLLREAILQVGHRQTRNRGTVGGSLCHLDPAAELPSVAAAYDAVIEVAGPKGRREVAFADFPAGFMTPAIAPDEIVTGVKFPAWPSRHGHAFVEFARRHGDFAMASAAVLLTRDSRGRIDRLSLTISGLTTAPRRMREVEKAALGQVPTEEVLRAASEECRKIEAVDDLHAPARYRQQLAAVLARRALDSALARAEAG
jgi:carbon-monoxide dehydrogenase medium subunit